jgi:hypothetical protein
MKRISFVSVSAAMILALPLPVYADIDISKTALGISPVTLHDYLSKEKFVFHKFSDKEIVAVKRIIGKVDSGTEFPDVNESTKITANICSGKVFRITMNSVYMGNTNSLLLGRKHFYEYIKENSGVLKGIDTHKSVENPTVVESFIIDRNKSGTSVRGSEEIKIALEYSRVVRNNNKDDPVLMMTYVLENKWFCPD